MKGIEVLRRYRQTDPEWVTHEIEAIFRATQREWKLGTWTESYRAMQVMEHGREGRNVGRSGKSI